MISSHDCRHLRCFRTAAICFSSMSFIDKNDMLSKFSLSFSPGIVSIISRFIFMSHYTTLPADFFNNILTQGDVTMIQSVLANPNLGTALQAISGYSKSLLETNVTKPVLQAFRDVGITCFGSTVKEARIKILEFLDQHPECRDMDPRRCINKILYWFCYQNHLQQEQGQQPVQANMIGFAFG